MKSIMKFFVAFTTNSLNIQKMRLFVTEMMMIKMRRFTAVYARKIFWAGKTASFNGPTNGINGPLRDLFIWSVNFWCFLDFHSFALKAHCRKPVRSCAVHSKQIPWLPSSAFKAPFKAIGYISQIFIYWQSNLSGCDFNSTHSGAHNFIPFNGFIIPFYSKITRNE